MAVPTALPCREYTAGPSLLLSHQGTRAIVWQHCGLQRWCRVRAVCLSGCPLFSTGLISNKKKVGGTALTGTMRPPPPPFKHVSGWEVGHPQAVPPTHADPFTGYTHADGPARRNFFAPSDGSWFSKYETGNALGIDVREVCAVADCPAAPKVFYERPTRDYSQVGRAPKATRDTGCTTQ